MAVLESKRQGYQDLRHNVNIVGSGKVLAQKYVKYRAQARQHLFLLLHLAGSTLTACLAIPL